MIFQFWHGPDVRDAALFIKRAATGSARDLAAAGRHFVARNVGSMVLMTCSTMAPPKLRSATILSACPISKNVSATVDTLASHDDANLVTIIALPLGA
jgi:hypothetical protein